MLALLAVLLSTQVTDKSLTCEEYVELGAPAHDRTWMGKDFTTSSGVLSKLAPEKMPRRDSKKSGAYFARLSSEDNFAPILKKDTDVKLRVQAASALIEGFNGLYKVYANAMIKDSSLDAELLTLTLAMLELETALFSVLEEFTATLSEEERNQDARKKGLQQMQSGFSTTVAASLSMFDDRKLFKIENLREFASRLVEVLPPLVVSLSQTSRKEIPIRLKTMVDEEKDEELKRSFSRLREALMKEEPKAKEK